MNILYHLTSPSPPIPGTDAVFQEIEALRRRFGGECLQLFPLRRPSRIFPKKLYGLHQHRALRRVEPSVDLHHLYYATLYPFPWLRALRKPLIYSAVTGVGAHIECGRADSSGKAAGRDWLKTVHTIVSCNPRDEAALRALRPARYRIIRPGIAVERFSPVPLPLRDELVLLVGSAPWIRRQFQTKGIDLLLDVAGSLPLRLVFLWRGLLLGELGRHIARRGLARRVEIINEATDVNRVLARVHATVVLAETESQVKAYPHSLMESLSAGKPALVSGCIPMADYVAETQCGEVVPRLTPDDLRAAIQRLMDHYGERQAKALARCRADFALAPMLEAYGEVYAQAVKPSGWRAS
ncbi:MAG: glycosyltransferase [Verrucomicrobia bacterium]|nr:glycosyltransferase [Verrucomicrobiota bacterium]